MKLDLAKVEVDVAANGMRTLLLSDAGGLTQYGCYIQTLLPGARSSERHWHNNEDEFLFVLTGQATVVDDQGSHTLGPLDAAAWPFGVANGHHVLNQSDAPVTYVILGSRVALDVCTYPDSGTQQINGVTDWKVVDAASVTLRGGALPPELLGLPDRWGTPADGPAQRILPAAGRVWVEEGDLPHPILGSGLGPYRHVRLGDVGGLSQFGVHLEELPPRSRSSFRHWHEAEDEMVLVLEGSAILVEEAETVLQPGDVVCWPAGVAVGHCLVNRSTAPARYLVIGTRFQRDRVHYPDDDLITEADGAARVWRHADGRVRRPGNPDLNVVPKGSPT